MENVSNLKEYDINGNLIIEKYFYSDGDLMWEDRYSYSDEGKLLEKQRIWTASFYEQIITYYNESEKPYEQNSKSRNGLDCEELDEPITFKSMTYEYDDKGQLICQKQYAPDDLLARQYDYKYDANGNMIYEKSTSHEGMSRYYDMGSDRCYDYTNTWEYDIYNNLLKHTYRYWVDNIFTYEYEYDGLGNLIKTSETFEGNDEVNCFVPGTVISEYSYVYDKSGNIRVVYYIIDGVTQYKQVYTPVKAVKNNLEGLTFEKVKDYLSY